MIDWDVRLAVRLLTTGALDPVIGTYRWVGGFSGPIGAINCTSGALASPSTPLAKLGAGVRAASRLTCSRIGQMLITHARHGFGPAQVALCLTDLKLARLAHPKHTAVEMAGYAACLREVTR